MNSDQREQIQKQKLVNTTHAATMLGVSVNTIRQWDSTGFLNSVIRTGLRGERWFSREDIEAIKHKAARPQKEKSYHDYVREFNQTLAKRYGVKPINIRELPPTPKPEKLIATISAKALNSVHSSD